MSGPGSFAYHQANPIATAAAPKATAPAVAPQASISTLSVSVPSELQPAGDARPGFARRLTGELAFQLVQRPALVVAEHLVLHRPG